MPAFFIISGFYMAMILGEKYRSQLWLFYSNRALRLYPMYWALLIIVVAMSQTRFGSWPLAQITAEAQNPLAFATNGTSASVAALIPNITFMGSDWIRLLIYDASTHQLSVWWRSLGNEGGNLVGAYRFLIVPPIWSLGVEIAFYAMAPFLARLSVRGLFIAMAGFCAMQFAIQFSMRDTVGWFHLIAPYNLCYFVLGMLAHRLWPVVRLRLHPKFVWSLAVLPIIVWATFQLTSTKQTSPIIWLAFAATIPALFELTKDWTFDAKLGGYSYPVYLVHFLFCSAMIPLGNFAGPAAFLLSAALSWILLTAVDEPIERWRQERARRSKVRTPAGAASEGTLAS